MTTRHQRAQLIKATNVDPVFNAETIRKLAQLARLPPDADLGAFGRSIRCCVRHFLDHAAVPQGGEIRGELQVFAYSVKRVVTEWPKGAEAAAEGLKKLSSEAQRHLDDHAAPYRSVPTRDELLDARCGRDAFSLLLGLLHIGAVWEPGRRRPGGKRSRDKLQGKVIGPPIRRGRPRNTPEFHLCNSLGAAYWKATGKLPPLKTRADAPGPFARLVREVLRQTGTPSVDAVELVNAHGRAWKKSKASRVSPN